MEPTYTSLSVLMAEYLHIVLLHRPFSPIFRLVLEHVFPLPRPTVHAAGNTVNSVMGVCSDATDLRTIEQIHRGLVNLLPGRVAVVR